MPYARGEALRQRLTHEKQLALDNELGQAHAVLGLLKFVHDFDWVGAETAFERALELGPGAADIYDHYGWLCAALERYDQALELVASAQELDPLMHRADPATTLLRAGRHEEAQAEAKRIADAEPDYPRARSTVGWAYLKLGKVKEGLSNLEQAARERWVSPCHMAYVYTGLGDADTAMDVLERSCAERAGSIYGSKGSFLFTSLRAHARFTVLLARMNLA